VFDIEVLKPIWFHEFAVLIAHWSSLYLYKELKCTFSKNISLRYLHWLALYVITTGLHSYFHLLTISFYNLKLTKLSTNRFCLLISKLFSCSVIGVALKVPLKQSLSFKFARFSFAHLVQGPDTPDAIRQRDAIFLFLRANFEWYVDQITPNFIALLNIWKI
jgi:hypothetical protein